MELACSMAVAALVLLQCTSLSLPLRGLVVAIPKRSEMVQHDPHHFQPREHPGIPSPQRASRSILTGLQSYNYSKIPSHLVR